MSPAPLWWPLPHWLSLSPQPLLTPTPEVLQHPSAARAAHTDWFPGAAFGPSRYFCYKKHKNLLKKLIVKSKTCPWCQASVLRGKKGHWWSWTHSGDGRASQQRQHQPPCPGQSSRASSTGLPAQPSPALHRSGTSSSSYLCRALGKHSQRSGGLEKGRD